MVRMHSDCFVLALGKVHSRENLYIRSIYAVMK